MTPEAAPTGIPRERERKPFRKGGAEAAPNPPVMSPEEKTYATWGVRFPESKTKTTEPTKSSSNPLNIRTGDNIPDFEYAAHAYKPEGAPSKVGTDTTETRPKVEPFTPMGKFNRSIYDNSPLTTNPMNQLNPDGSNREDFNYAAFAYRDPSSKQPQESAPKPTTPEPTIPEPEPKPVVPELEPEVTAKETNEVVEVAPLDLNLDIAVGQLTEQEKKEIIRERQRDAEDMAQEQALATGWLAGLKFRMKKNIEKFRMLDTLRGLPTEEIFGSEVADFRKRSDQRAEELASLMADNEFTKLSKNKGFEGAYIDLMALPGNKERGEKLAALIKEYAKDPKKSRDAFELAKKQIITDMIASAPQLEGVISDNFDNVWAKVEYVRERAGALKLSADKIDAMNISLNIRFGAARFESMTKDQETLSNKVEDRLMKSKWINSLPFERRYWVQGAIIGGSSVASSAIQKLTGWSGLVTGGFTAVLAGGLSGAIEYKRKRDQLSETHSRLTRRMARGGSSGDMLTKYEPDFIKDHIKLVDLEPLATSIQNKYDLIKGKTPVDPKAVESLLGEIAKFQALYEQEQKSGDRFRATSKDKLNQLKLDTLRNSSRIISELGTVDPTTGAKYKQTLESSRTKLEKESELDKQIFEKLARNKALTSAAVVGAVSATLSFAFSSAYLKEKLAAGASYIGSKAAVFFGSTPEQASTWAASHGLGFLVPKTTYQVVETPREITQTLTATESLNKLLGSSKTVDAIQRIYNGTAEGQIAKFGGLTRSMWSSTPGEGAVLGIFGRTMSGGKTLLHDFDKGFLDAFQQGKFQVLVNLADGHKVLASPSTLYMDHGVLKVDFSRDPGILGEIFKNGHEKGLAMIENIQYGVGDGNKMEVVSTIAGGGKGFIPDAQTVTQKIIDNPLRINQEFKFEDTPIMIPLFRSPMSGRNRESSEKKSGSKESKPASNVFPRIVPVMSNTDPSLNILTITDSNKKPVSDDELLSQLLETTPEAITAETPTEIILPTATGEITTTLNTESTLAASENNLESAEIDRELVNEFENNKEMLHEFLKFLLDVKKSIDESNENRNVYQSVSLFKTKLENNKVKNKILLKYFSELLKDNRVRDINYITSLVKKFEIAYKYFKSSK